MRWKHFWKNRSTKISRYYDTYGHIHIRSCSGRQSRQHNDSSTKTLEVAVPRDANIDSKNGDRRRKVAFWSELGEFCDTLLTFISLSIDI